MVILLDGNLNHIAHARRKDSILHKTILYKITDFTLYVRTYFWVNIKYKYYGIREFHSSRIYGQPRSGLSLDWNVPTCGLRGIFS